MLGFSSLLPSPSNSNLSLAVLFPPPKLTLAGKSHAPQRRAEDPLPADTAAAAMLHVTSPQTSGQRGIHSRLSLLPESHLLASMRQPDRRHKRAQKRLYLWRSVQIQPRGSGGSVTVGTFLLSFFLADRTHPRDFTSGRNALKRFFFFYDEGVSRRISISSNSTGDCWGGQRALLAGLKETFFLAGRTEGHE